MACLPCKEIIDNGLTAIAADLLAITISPTSGLAADAARQLADAARAANEMYAVAQRHNVLNLSGGFVWAGCHKATQIMAWVREIDDVAPDTVIASMRQWRAEIIVDMANLVAGGRQTS